MPATTPLAERNTWVQHIENIGDADLEREVRDWYQHTDNDLQFAEDYVSGDSGVPQRYGVDWPEWNQRWKNLYTLHANQIIAMDRIAKLLKGKHQATLRERRLHGQHPRHPGWEARLLDGVV